MLNNTFIKYASFALFFFIVSFMMAQKKGSENNANTQTIEYKVLAKKEGFEIRKYPELTVASTELSSISYASNSSTGFRKVASYIFGGNSTNEQIAMTSPVQMDMGSEPSMSFFMPDDMEVKDLPIPTNKDLSIHVQPSKIVAAIQFSGWASDDVLTKHFNELKSKLKRESIEFEDSYSYLGYSPPYQMENRKNEIIIPLINYK